MHALSSVATERVVRVLLADDHSAVLRGVRAIVESAGRFQVVGEARDGREAHRLACELSPQIAIIDFLLPEMNGLDLARAIKRDSPGTEILLFTMHERDELISDVLRAGVRGYVFKAEPQRHLIAALAALSAGQTYLSPAVSDAVLQYWLGNKSTALPSVITRREREVVQLIAEGRLNKQIAARLGVAVKTVETHRASAMRKLELRTTADVVRWAVRNHLIQP